MIKVNTYFERQALCFEKKKESFLVELSGIKKETKEKVKRKKLNISLCIDISGSMGQSIDGVGYGYMTLNQMLGQDFGNPQLGRNRETPSVKTKLELIKQAAINAMSTMKDGDILSIVAFDNKVELVQEAIELNKQNRVDIVKAINTLFARGTTNIHGGWIRSVEEVAKNVSKKNLNRVILLTDGQANAGKTNVDSICEDVFNVAGKDVSTTTFGVGKDFNEDLLSAMSDSGSGNFYFINEADNFDSLFNEEFTGLSNVCATGIKLKLKLNKEIEFKPLTEMKEEKGTYIIQDLTTTSKLPVLFELKTGILPIGEHEIGKLKVKYTDISGSKEVVEKIIKVKVVNKDTWDLMDEVEEVKVQELLVTVAKNKMKARDLFADGAIAQAQGVLRASSAMLSSSNYSDERLTTQVNSLDDTVLSSENEDSAVMSKKMHYESYRTLKGKDI